MSKSTEEFVLLLRVVAAPANAKRRCRSPHTEEKGRKYVFTLILFFRAFTGITLTHTSRAGDPLAGLSLEVRNGQWIYIARSSFSMSGWIHTDWALSPGSPILVCYTPFARRAWDSSQPPLPAFLHRPMGYYEAVLDLLRWPFDYPKVALGGVFITQDLVEYLVYGVK